jgi:hypothetical protein
VRLRRARQEESRTTTPRRRTAATSAFFRTDRWPRVRGRRLRPRARER